MMMESSSAGTGAFIAPRIPGLHSEGYPASRGGLAVAQSGKSTEIPAPGRVPALRFATYFGTRNRPRELLGGRLRRAARRAEEELRAPRPTQEWRHTARLRASRASHRLLQCAHWCSPNAPDAREMRRQATAAIPPRPHLATGARAPLLGSRNRRQFPARVRCR